MEKRKKGFEDFEGKKVLILCSNGFKYKTDHLHVDAFSGVLTFKDKFGEEVLLSTSQVSSIVEVRSSG